MGNALHSRIEHATPPKTNLLLELMLTHVNTAPDWMVSGQVRSGQVKSGQVRSGQVRSGHVRSGQVRSVYVKSSQVI